MYIGCVFCFQAEDGIRDIGVTGVQTCALPICKGLKANVVSKDLKANAESKDLKANVESKGLKANAESKDLKANAESKDLKARSEESRVGNEWRSRWSPCH